MEKTARKGLRVERHFTEVGYDMRRVHTPTLRNARILRADGSVKFEQTDVEAPSTWSDLAVAVTAQKYFWGPKGSKERETSVYDMVERVVRTSAAWLGFTTTPEEWASVSAADPDIRWCQGEWQFFTEEEQIEENDLESYGDQLITVTARPPDNLIDEGEVYLATYGDWRAYVDELKEILISQRASFNSPVWFNVGTRGPRAGNQQCSACFITRVEDYMADEGPHGILDLYRTEGKIFKRGSGSGHEVSRMRSSKEPVAGGGFASGALSFEKGFDRSGRGIQSGGRVRRAAMMRTCNADYGDIVEFVRAKSREEAKARALAGAGYGSSLDGESYDTVAFQGANFSVRVTDSFMRRAVSGDAGDPWPLVSRTLLGIPANAVPVENMLGGKGYVLEEISASKLLDDMAKCCWECGCPGIQFADVINDWHTCSDEERINSSNPCSEYLFLDNTACNLASLNLTKFVHRRDDGTLLFLDQAFEATVRIMITAMEGWVSCADYPTPTIAHMSHHYRTLGIGYGNLGAMLMRAGLPYDSNEGRALAGAVTSLLCALAYDQSAALAEVMGPFPGYDKNQDSFLRVMKKHSQHSHELLKGIEHYHEKHGTRTGMSHAIASRAHDVWARVAWKSAQEKRTGFRNAQTVVIAPTGTIGLKMDFDTTGIEPLLGHITYKKLVGGGEMKLVCRASMEALHTLGYDTEVKNGLAKWMVEEGKPLEEFDGIRKEHLPVFDTSFPSNGGKRSLSWDAHVRMLAATQPFVSGSISKTINMPATATPEDIRGAFVLGWQLGLKCMAIYRDGSKVFQPVSTKSGESNEEMASLGGKTKMPAGEETGTDRKPSRRSPPRRFKSDRLKFRVGPHKGYLHPAPPADEVDPEQGGTLLECFVRFSNLGSAISGWAEAFSILLSIAVQYGVPLRAIVSKLKDVSFEPSGFTDDPEIRSAPSVPAYLVRRIGMDYLPRAEREALGLLPGIDSGMSSSEDIPGTSPVEPQKPAGEEIVPKTPRPRVSPSGRVCGECGSFSVAFIGSFNCLQCQTCGWSEGGCAG